MEMQFAAPESLREEHADILRRLEAAAQGPGAGGAAARDVLELIGPHVAREDEFVLPPLSLLHALASGRFSPEMRAVLALTDRLKFGLPALLADHSAITAALARLREAARAGPAECADLAERLTRHIQFEEDVLYPASLLIGEYVRFRGGR
jgi:hypothetical protein